MGRLCRSASCAFTVSRWCAPARMNKMYHSCCEVRLVHREIVSVCRRARALTPRGLNNFDTFEIVVEQLRPHHLDCRTHGRGCRHDDRPCECRPRHSCRHQSPATALSRRTAPPTAPTLRKHASPPPTPPARALEYLRFLCRDQKQRIIRSVVIAPVQVFEDDETLR